MHPVISAERPAGRVAAPMEARLDIRHVVVAGRDDHPSAANGVHNVARRLVQEQRAAGQDARLYLLTYDAPAQRAFAEGQIVPIAGISLRGRIVRLRRAVIDTLLAGAGDRTVVHIHGGREPLLIGLAARLHALGIPYAVTGHGRYSHVYDRDGACLRRSTALYLRLFERPMLARARFVQALSAPEAAILRRIAPGSRIEIVGNGAYSSRLGPALEPPEHRPASAGFPHFVFCGRYAIHHKGLDLLLRGFALYRRGGGQGRLTTIGSGPGLSTLQAMAAELGIASAACIEGPRFGQDRDTALQGGDYFVMASRYEGIPLAALEAAACGLPLIVTPETGLAEAVRTHKAGEVIEALSPEAVAAAFRRAAAAPAEWAERRSAAHDLAREIGNWSGISDSLCALYGSSEDLHPARQAITS